jgi:hypothetical protein
MTWTLTIFGVPIGRVDFVVVGFVVLASELRQRMSDDSPITQLPERDEQAIFLPSY